MIIYLNIYVYYDSYNNHFSMGRRGVRWGKNYTKNEGWKLMNQNVMLRLI